jgi:siderophore synthetase component/RimJ/RimL family protein N-acetyltransferase
MLDELKNFYFNHPRLGEFEIRRMNAANDTELFYSWVQQDYASFWGLVGKTKIEVEEFYQSLIDSKINVPFLGYHDGKPAFIMECYLPAFDPVGEQYDVEVGDLGMHILISPPKDDGKRHFTLGVFHSIMKFMFSGPSVRRIVVEPDIRNHKIHRLNRKVGFEHTKTINLSDKKAYLGFCTKERFEHAYANYLVEEDNPKALVLEHQDYNQDLWNLVNLKLVKKCISEFSHELMIEPQLVHAEGRWGQYKIDVPNSEVGAHYLFHAQILELDHWNISLNSLKKVVASQETPVDALHFIVEFRELLGIEKPMLPTYLEEISSTLGSSYFKHTKDRLSIEQLVRADFQQIEGAMIEGHPCFVANNGRVGYSNIEYLNYSPEAEHPIKVIWLAAHKSKTVFSSSKCTDYERLLRDEFDLSILSEFNAKLRSKDLDPEDYFLIPVHPWQWTNKINIFFASDLASRCLVYLGESQELYRAQQSIRTLFNTSNPQKHYLKMALSILNMGFVRGLSAEYMEVNPAINDWVYDLLVKDPFLVAKGFRPLRELAAIGFKSEYYSGLIDKSSIHNKLLAALWRESPVRYANEGQQLMTMAALIHENPHGEALLPAMISNSGLATEEWMRQYLEAFLHPIIHCFYRYNLIFMPHGENIILVCEDSVPTKVFLKDIGEEVGLLEFDAELPENVARILSPMNDDVAILWILADIFDGFFRFMAEILANHIGYSGEQFWQCVASSIQEYQAQFPELQEKYDRYDLFTETFHRQCLNRLQLKNNKQMVDLGNVAGSLQYSGVLENPIARFKVDHGKVKSYVVDLSPSALQT